MKERGYYHSWEATQDKTRKCNQAAVRTWRGDDPRRQGTDRTGVSLNWPCILEGDLNDSKKPCCPWPFLTPGAEAVLAISRDGGGTAQVLKRSKNCCRKEDPFQGPKLGSCLTLGNELSEETQVLTKQEIFLGKGARVESRRVREPRRTALPRGSQSWVLWWWD